MKLLELEIEVYTDEGLDISKWDEEKAKDMTHWVPYYFNPSQILFVADSMDKKGHTCLGLFNGVSYTAKGNAKSVKKIIEDFTVENFSYIEKTHDISKDFDIRY